MSIIPLVVNSIYSLKNGREALQKAAFEKLEAVRESKNSSITRYLETISLQVITSAHDKTLIDASKELMGAFKKTPLATDEFTAKLGSYYVDEVGKEYKTKTGSVSPLDKTYLDLSKQNIMLQHAFISNNSNPLGSKHLLDESALVPEYSKSHKIYHPVIREFLEAFALYDVFIIDIESGDVIYTVFKELDFTTNLITGPYRDTNLAEAFSKAKKLTDKKGFVITDFKKYAPSYESPASFIATPIWDGDKKIAVLAFQMPLAVINSIMAERSGLGETGETYLVGEDKKLRSDTFNNKEMNIFNSFNKNMLIESANIQSAIKTKAGSMITQK
jgi:methyl-accepting chemotaxis protein